MDLDADDPNCYLDADDIVDDHTDLAIRTLPADLRQASSSHEEFARTAFDWVRDTIAHSWDAQDPRVTFRATEVLAEGVGLCYASDL